MFKYKKSLNANQGRVFIEFVLVGSQTFTIGDAVRLTAAGVLDLAGAGATVAGIIEGFKINTGKPLTDNGAGAAFTNTYTTPAANATVTSITVWAKIDISKNSVYSCVADATVGTTTGSNLAGYTMDIIAASDTLDESTALTTTGQFVSLGLDPDEDAPSNSVLVKIFESQLV